ncbi:MAG: hypothetical protein RBT69_13095 [Spirochaetia bacterium]|jgi:hypothetical protein|nr:hypothetical protein [Spirochaetia bacterium]
MNSFNLTAEKAALTVTFIFFILICSPLKAQSSATFGYYKTIKKLVRYSEVIPSARAVIKAGRYTPLASATLATVETIHLINEIKTPGINPDREFYKKLTLIPVRFAFGTGGAVTAVTITSPACIMAGILTTPVVGATCSIAAGMAGYAAGSKAGEFTHSAIFNVLWPKKKKIVIEDVVNTRKEIQNKIITISSGETL